MGIGGAGMSGIAEVLLKLGYRVTGSDLSKNPAAHQLEKLGATVFEGHHAKNSIGADVVVTSTAIDKKNPEVMASLKGGIPVIPRIEMLAEIARLKYTIAIAGTHGKTTTTSLVASIFYEAKLDPTVVVGGKLHAVGTGGVLGKGDYLIAEADESDGSFLKLSPTISVVTNIDNDHLDYYKTMDRLEDAFVQFAGHVPFYGSTYLCGDDPIVRKILPRLSRRYAVYGFDKKFYLSADHVKYSEEGTQFDVYLKGKILGHIQTPLAGRHNVLNALAAIAVGLHADIPFAKIASGLANFGGVGRRMEKIGDANGVLVMDDYGHHPTEIKATLAAIKSRWPKRRLVVVFQPHRYSRTQLLYKQFADALKNVDKLILLPIYPAGEKPIRGVSSHLIMKFLKKNKATYWEKGIEVKDISGEVEKGDILLTLGAGNVHKLGAQFYLQSTSLPTILKQDLPSMADRIKENENLERHCTWGIGGSAEAYVEAHTLDELKKVLAICAEQNSEILFLGWGSNVLLPSEGVAGAVIRLRGEFETIKFVGNEVHVGAGVHLPKLAKACAEKGLSGVEAMAGIPGTVGGALNTNAGTPRGVIGDVVKSVDIITPAGVVETIPAEQIQFEYRHTSLVGKWIVGAVLTLKVGDVKAIKEKVQWELDYRAKTQPLGTKNVGSVFRNPKGDHAARLIEAVGLKGKSFGSVRFSPKHSNFIENTGHATSAAALELMRLAQLMVKEKFKVDLIPEVIIVEQIPPS